MHHVKRIIEFHQRGRSAHQMDRLNGLSRNTIREYLRRISLSGKSLEDLLKPEDEPLMAIVQTDALEKSRPGRCTDERHKCIEGKLEYYKAELARRGVRRKRLWQEYR